MTSIGSTTNAPECPFCFDLLSLDSTNPAVKTTTEINPCTGKFYSCLETCAEDCQLTAHKCKHVFHEECLQNMNEAFAKQQKSNSTEPLSCCFCQIRITSETTGFTPEEFAEFAEAETKANQESNQAAAKASEEINRIKQEKLAKEKEEAIKNKKKKIFIAKVTAISLTVLTIIGAILLAIILV